MENFNVPIHKLKTVKTKTSPKIKSRSRTENTFTKGVLSYKGQGEFNVITSKGIIPKVNNTDIIYSFAKVLYTLPENDKHPNWTNKVKSYKGLPSHYNIVSNYWSPFKDGMKVKGIIKDDTFEVFYIGIKRII